MRVFIGPTFVGGVPLFLTRLAVSVVLAELSFRFVERPFRTGSIARRMGSRGAVAYFALLVLITGALVTTVARPEPLPPHDLSGFVADPSLRRIDTFGDSTAFVFGYSGQLHSKELGITIGGDANLGCGIVQAEHYNGDVVFANPDYCKGWEERWRLKLLAEPNALVLLMGGAWDVLDHQIDGQRVRFGTPEWTGLVTAAYRDALRVLTEGGRTAYSWEVPCYGPGDPSAPIPDRGSPERIDAVNAIFQQLSREMPHVELVHWRELVCPNGRRVEKIDGVQLWEPDNVHLKEGGAVIVWKWWLRQLPAAP